MMETHIEDYGKSWEVFLVVRRAHAETLMPYDGNGRTTSLPGRKRIRTYFATSASFLHTHLVRIRAEY